MTTQPISSDYHREVFYPEADGKPMAEGDAQRKTMVYAIAALTDYYKGIEDAYVSGNMFIYYKEGEPAKVVAPDVFVVFDVPKKDRNIFKVWEEGQVPAFIIEVTSKSTKKEDLKSKFQLYQRLGVQEYMLYDPTGDYLKPRLKSFCLRDGKFQKLPALINPEKGLCIKSDSTDLLFCATDKGLRIWDELRNDYLDSPEEAFARVEREMRRADQEKQRADEEKQRADEEKQRADEEKQRAFREKQRADEAHQLLQRLIAEGKISAQDLNG